MRNHSKEIEAIAIDLLSQSGEKPNYRNIDLTNTVLIFQTALMDKLFDNQNYINMSLADRCIMAENCGKELREFILKYTGLDTMREPFNEYLNRLKDKRTEDGYNYTDDDFKKHEDFIRFCWMYQMSVCKCLELFFLETQL